MPENSQKQIFASDLTAAVLDEAHRQAALITFLVTLSGIAIAGVGSAFWGVVAGGMALFVQQYGQARRAPLSGPAKTTTNSRSLKNS